MIDHSLGRKFTVRMETMQQVLKRTESVLEIITPKHEKEMIRQIDAAIPTMKSLIKLRAAWVGSRNQNEKDQRVQDYVSAQQKAYQDKSFSNLHQIFFAPMDHRMLYDFTWCKSKELFKKICKYVYLHRQMNGYAFEQYWKKHGGGRPRKASLKEIYDYFTRRHETMPSESGPVSANVGRRYTVDSFFVARKETMDYYGISETHFRRALKKNGKKPADFRVIRGRKEIREIWRNEKKQARIKQRNFRSFRDV